MCEKGEEDVLAEINAERERQIKTEGWTQEHDDQHVDGEMARAASCYAADPRTLRMVTRHGDGGYGSAAPAKEVPQAWPWANCWWKPTDRRRDLVKAGALIVAEIERLDRSRASDRSA